MLLVEKIEDINKWLARDFGKFEDGRPNWRVVLCADQYEKRWIDVTKDGFQLLHPEVREVKKYDYIAPDRYILERLVPVVGETDVTTKTSYEPAWVFQDRKREYLPPRYDVCKFIIDGIHGQEDRANTYRKYTDPDINPENLKQKIDDMKFKLFGDETATGDALAHGFGVTDFNQKVDISSPVEETKEAEV